jgi:hypothetical protein
MGSVSTTLRGPAPRVVPVLLDRAHRSAAPAPAAPRPEQHDTRPRPLTTGRRRAAQGIHQALLVDVLGAAERARRPAHAGSFGPAPSRASTRRRASASEQPYLAR